MAKTYGFSSEVLVFLLQPNQWSCLGHAHVLKFLLPCVKKGGTIDIITQKVSTNIFRHPLNCCNSLGKFRTTPLLFWYSYIFLILEWVVKLIHEGGKFSHPQGWTYCYHDIASKIYPCDILCTSFCDIFLETRKAFCSSYRAILMLWVITSSKWPNHITFHFSSDALDWLLLPFLACAHFIFPKNLSYVHTIIS